MAWVFTHSKSHGETRVPLERTVSRCEAWKSIMKSVVWRLLIISLWPLPTINYVKVTVVKCCLLEISSLSEPSGCPALPQPFHLSLLRPWDVCCTSVFLLSAPSSLLSPPFTCRHKQSTSKCLTLALGESQEHSPNAQVVVPSRMSICHRKTGVPSRNPFCSSV